MAFSGDDKNLFDFFKAGSPGKGPSFKGNLSNNPALSSAIADILNRKHLSLLSNLEKFQRASRFSGSGFEKLRIEAADLQNMRKHARGYGLNLSSLERSTVREINSIVKDLEWRKSAVDQQNELIAEETRAQKIITDAKKEEARQEKQRNIENARQEKQRISEENKRSKAESSRYNEYLKNKSIEQKQQEREGRQRNIENARRLRFEATSYKRYQSTLHKRELTVGNEFYADAKNKHWRDALFGEEHIRKAISRTESELVEARANGNPHTIEHLEQHLHSLKEQHSAGKKMLSERYPLYGKLQKTKWGSSLLSNAGRILGIIGAGRMLAKGINATMGLPQSISAYYNSKFGPASPFFNAEMQGARLGAFGGFSGKEFVGNQHVQAMLGSQYGMSMSDLSLLNGVTPRSKQGILGFMGAVGAGRFGIGIQNAGFMNFSKPEMASYLLGMRSTGMLHSFRGNSIASMNARTSALLSIASSHGLNPHDMLSQYTGLASQYGSLAGTTAGFGGITSYIGNLIGSGNPALRSVSGAAENIFKMSGGIASGVGSDPFKTLLATQIVPKMTHNFNVASLRKLGITNPKAIKAIQELVRSGNIIGASKSVLDVAKYSAPAEIYKGTEKFFKKHTPYRDMVPYFLSQYSGMNIETTADTISGIPNTSHDELLSNLNGSAGLVAGMSKQDLTGLRHTFGEKGYANFSGAQSAAAGMIHILTRFSGVMNTFSSAIINLKQDLDHIVDKVTPSGSFSTPSNRTASPSGK